MHKALLVCALAVLSQSPSSAIKDCWNPPSPDGLVGPSTLIVAGTITELVWDPIDCIRDDPADEFCRPVGLSRRHEGMQRSTATISITRVLRGAATSRVTFDYYRRFGGIGHCPYANVEEGSNVVAIIQQEGAILESLDAVVPGDHPDFKKWKRAMRHAIDER